MHEKRLTIRESIRNFSILSPYFYQSRIPLAIGLLSLLAVDLLQLVVPLIIKRSVDDLAAGQANGRTLLLYAAAIMCIAIAIGGLRYVWRIGIFGLSRKIEMGLRNEMFSRMLTLSPSFFQKNPTGDLMARAVNDINAVRMASGMGLVAMIDATVLGVASIAFMLSIDVRLTLICLIPGPFVVIMGRKLTRRMSVGFEKVQQAFSGLTERVREGFTGIRIIKANAKEPWQFERVRKEGEQYIKENMTLARTMALFFPVMAVFTNLGLAIVLWMGGRLTISGSISPGDLVAFTNYLNIMAWPIMAMGWVANLIQRGGASLKRIRSVVEQMPEVEDGAIVLNPAEISGKIRFNNFSFRYDDQNEFILRGINLEIPPGQTAALVGRVGSGKSTLLSALPRLLTIPGGAVFIDQHDITSLSLKSLRKSMGFVTQDVFIFSDTVRNNVLMGRQHIKEGRVEEVLELAQIWDEVSSLEKGLDTLVGERGITLSGGQRQRLTIARALLEDPPVLIMDDALSMVDSRTEEKILSNIIRARAGKTTLITTHRIATLKSVERILVMEKGELLEDGDHGGLLAMGGIYSTIYESKAIEAELEREAS